MSLDSKGRVLATCLGEEALLTDLEDGKTLARIEGDGEVLTTLKITPSASHIILCSRSLSMRIYALGALTNSNVISVTLVRVIKPHGTPVVTAVVDSTSSILATGGADGSIKVWDIQGGYVSHTFRGHTGIISALQFFELPPELASKHSMTTAPSKSKKRNTSQREIHGTENAENSNEPILALRLASGGEDGKIRIWDLAGRKAVACLDSHISVVRALDYSPRQNLLISGSRDKTLICWDVKTWKIIRTIPVLESLEIIGFISDGQLAYTGGEHGRLRIWDIHKGRETTAEQAALGEGDGITQALYCHSSNILMTVHIDQRLKFHSLDGLASVTDQRTVAPLPIAHQLSGTLDEVIDMAYVGLEKKLMALATNSESVRLVSVEMQSLKHEMTPYFGADVAQLEGHEDIVICLDVDWSGCWLVTGAKDNSARLWSLDTLSSSYECRAVYTGHAESLGAIALPVQRPQDDSAASKDPLKHPPNFMVTGSQDKTIKLWKISVDSRKPPSKTGAIYTRRAHEKDINALAFNHDSSLFASASQDRTVRIWSVEDGEAQGVLRGHKRGVWSVTFASKDKLSISGEFSGASSGRGLVLTGSGDKTVKIWSLADYSCVRTFEGHTNSILKVIWLPQAFNKQGTQGLTTQQSPLIASAGSDGLVKIWDASMGECACTLDNHMDRVWSLALNPLTGHLVSGGADGVVTFWADTTASTRAAAAAVNTVRIEQEQELINYVHRGNYREAIVLALQLNHPARLLALFTDVISRYPPEGGSLSGLYAVDDVLANLSGEELHTLLLRIRDWNTNARTAPIAQRLLWVVMKIYPASHLVKFRKKNVGLYDVMKALQSYTERHYKQCEELIEESYLIDFVVRGMEEGGFIVGRHEGGKELDEEAMVVG